MPSFIEIEKDQRDKIFNEFMQMKRNIQKNSLAEKVKSVQEKVEHEKLFQPITENLHQIEKELGKQRDKNDISLGPIATKYLRKALNKTGVDTTFGIQNNNGVLYIGKKPITFKDDDILIDDVIYKGTDGLWNLIVEKQPNRYTEEDLINYRNIMLSTDAIFQSNGKPKSSRGKKYNEIIKPIYQSTLTGNGETLYLPSDPKALISRMDLLFASRNAGHTGVDNELGSIIDELYRQKEITKNQYKELTEILA